MEIDLILKPDAPDSCVLPLETEPTHPEFLELSIAGVQIPHVVDCASEDGWAFTFPDGPFEAIELCGQACVDFKLVGEATLEYFCESP